MKPPFDSLTEEVRQAIEAAVQRLLTHRTWCHYDGESLRELAQSLSEGLQRPFVQLTCSGTIAVELACRGLGVESGDVVMMAGYDYPGNFRSVELLGARPWLVDVPRHRWSLDWSTIESALQEQSFRPKVLLLSHLHGTLAALAEIVERCHALGILVLEDACQAHGAHWEGRQVGSWGDVSVLSFGGSKLMTSGRGGAVMTGNERVHQRMLIFRERGNDAFAMSELQACTLLPQWRVLPTMTQHRWENVKWLEANLRSTVVHAVHRDPGNSWPAFYKWGLWIEGETGEQRLRLRERIVQALEQANFHAGAGFMGFQRRSERRCIRPHALPHSELAAESTLLIHHSHLLEPRERLLELLQLLNRDISREW